MRLRNMLLSALLVFATAIARADTITNIVTLDYTALNGQQQVSFSLQDGQQQNGSDYNFAGTLLNQPTDSAAQTVFFEIIEPKVIEVKSALGLKTQYLLKLPDTVTHLVIDPATPDLHALFLTPGTYKLDDSFAVVTAGSSPYFINMQDVSLTITQTGAVAVTPEPSSLTLLGTGLLSMGGLIKRRLC